MHIRLIRFSILGFLIVVGIVAGFFLWGTQQQSIALQERSAALAVRLDAVLADLGELGGAQQAYIAPGQSDGPWMERVSSLLQRLYDDTAAIGSHAEPSAKASLRSIRESLDAFVAIDARVREYLGVRQELMASDLVFNDAHSVLTALETTVRSLRAREATQSVSAARSRAVLQASIVGGAAASWMIGMILLVRVPRTASTPLATAITAEPLADTAVQAEIAPAVSPVDWNAAANVCSELARLTDGAKLPPLFTDAARALDASGIILWLGAGEQLFAAAAHGYAPRTLTRLGPIGRDADNATAAAWRDGQLRTVAGDAAANGAIVAPLTGPDGCRGVLAVEMRHGREADSAAQAVTTMVAAQLAGVVAAWPAASAAIARAI